MLLNWNRGKVGGRGGMEFISNTQAVRRKKTFTKIDVAVLKH
jgi:hypothetical protein